MKVLILSDANSIHTYRWAKSLSEKGIIIEIVSKLNNNGKIVIREKIYSYDLFDGGKYINKKEIYDEIIVDLRFYKSFDDTGPIDINTVA